MKTWTIQFDMQEGNDEFWESNPSPEEVLIVVKDALESAYIDYFELKCIKIVDRKQYYPKQGEEET